MTDSFNQNKCRSCIQSHYRENRNVCAMYDFGDRVVRTSIRNCGGTAWFPKSVAFAASIIIVITVFYCAAGLLSIVNGVLQ